MNYNFIMHGQKRVSFTPNCILSMLLHSTCVQVPCVTAPTAMPTGDVESRTVWDALMCSEVSTVRITLGTVM